MFCVIVNNPEERKKEWLNEVEGIIDHYFPAVKSFFFRPPLLFNF
jgi:hypothetical protein